MEILRVRVSINPNTIVDVLSSIVTFLIAMGSLVALILTFTSYKTVMGLVQLFDMDLERTITAYFSSLNLLFAGFLLGCIAYSKRKKLAPFWRHWLGLSVGFILMSLDEAVSMHELVMQILRDYNVGAKAPPHYMTTVIGGIVLLALLIPYAQFLWHLPVKSRYQFILAGGLFVLGAFGVESLGGYFFQHADYWPKGYYYAAVVVEESLEMIGVLLFIKALFIYIEGLMTARTMQTVEDYKLHALLNEELA